MEKSGGSNLFNLILDHNKSRFGQPGLFLIHNTKTKPA